MSQIDNEVGVPEDPFLREGLIDRLQQYLAAEPGAWHIRYNLGVALASDGRMDEAAAEFRQVLQQAPKHLQSMVNLAGIHLQKGQPDQALQVLVSALSVWDVPVVRANLAVAYLQMERLEEAERELRRALALDPNLPDVLTNLGSTLLRQGRLEDSLEPSRRALELRPDFAMAHNNLAVALQELGREDEAREHAQAARRLGYPVHPELWARLGLPQGQPKEE